MINTPCPGPSILLPLFSLSLRFLSVRPAVFQPMAKLSQASSDVQRRACVGSWRPEQSRVRGEEPPLSRIFSWIELKQIICASPSEYLILPGRDEQSELSTCPRTAQLPPRHARQLVQGGSRQLWKRTGWTTIAMRLPGRNPDIWR